MGRHSKKKPQPAHRRPAFESTACPVCHKKTLQRCPCGKLHCYNPKCSTYDPNLHA